LVTARSFGQGDGRPFELLKRHDYESVKLNNHGPLDAGRLRALIPGFDAVIAGLDTYSRPVFEGAPGLKVVSRYGVGYDKIDMDAAREHGVAVTVTPGANENSVADLSMALMLSAARFIPFADREAKTGDFNRKIGVEMWQKTLGIIGLGRIGRGVVKRANGFSMDIICYDVMQDDEFARGHGVRYAGFEELLQNADFITIHTPLNDQTRHLLGAAQFAMMKKSAVLVNTARGGIVDERALYEALRNNGIAAAALDVTEDEPPAGSPLLRLDNCIVTSHIGGYTKDAVLSMGMAAAQNVIDILETGSCVNEI